MGGGYRWPIRVFLTGSLKDDALLLFWWFIVPALIWPYDLYLAIYHKVFR